MLGSKGEKEAEEGFSVGFGTRCQDETIPTKGKNVGHNQVFDFPMNLLVVRSLNLFGLSNPMPEIGPSISDSECTFSFPLY